MLLGRPLLLCPTESQSQGPFWPPCPGPSQSPPPSLGSRCAGQVGCNLDATLPAPPVELADTHGPSARHTVTHESWHPPCQGLPFPAWVPVRCRWHKIKETFGPRGLHSSESLLRILQKIQCTKQINAGYPFVELGLGRKLSAHKLHCEWAEPLPPCCPHVRHLKTQDNCIHSSRQDT